MEVAIPLAFNLSFNVVARLNAEYGITMPVPIPVGEAWIITKTDALTLDYFLEEKFFLATSKESLKE